jgi:hypothetical protein
MRERERELENKDSIKDKPLHVMRPILESLLPDLYSLPISFL